MRLVLHCLEYYKKIMNVSNCLDIWSLAWNFDVKELLKWSGAFIHSKFIDVIKNVGFLQLTEEQVTAIFKGIRLYVKDRKDILNSLKRWRRHDSRNRKKSYKILLNNTKFSGRRKEVRKKPTKLKVSNKPIKMKVS